MNYRSFNRYLYHKGHLRAASQSKVENNTKLITVWKFSPQINLQKKKKPITQRCVPTANSNKTHQKITRKHKHVARWLRGRTAGAGAEPVWLLL